MPQTQRDYWIEKFAKTEARDRATTERLHAEGWTVQVIWECETNDVPKLRRRLELMLNRSALIAHP